MRVSGMSATARPSCMFSPAFSRTRDAPQREMTVRLTTCGSVSAKSVLVNATVSRANPKSARFIRRTVTWDGAVGLVAPVGKPPAAAPARPHRASGRGRLA